MTKQITILKTLLLQLLLLMCVAGCAIGKGKREAPAGSGPNVLSGSAGSCAAPDPSNATRCRQMEAQILATTVRLQIDVLALQDGRYQIVDSSLGHATVMDGRYLVTHNHFSLTLENLNDGKMRRLTAYSTDGTLLVRDAPFHVFDVLVAEPQTLVLDFGTYGRQGTLAYNGLASSEFREPQALDLRPGAEVAQVSWDGAATTVNWVTVTAVSSDRGTPVLALDGDAVRGSSGGGIFYEGYHVGNNWYRATEKHAETGQVLRRYTVAASNVAALLALAGIGAHERMADAALREAPDVANEAGTTELLIQ